MPREAVCSSSSVLPLRTADHRHSSFADLVEVSNLNTPFASVVAVGQSRGPHRFAIRTIWPHRAVTLARTRNAHQSKQHGAEEASQPVCQQSGGPIRKRVERRNHDQ